MQKLEALAGKIVGDASAVLGVLLAYIGDQAGVYRSMADVSKSCRGNCLASCA